MLFQLRCKQYNYIPGKGTTFLRCARKKVFFVKSMVVVCIYALFLLTLQRKLVRLIK